MQAARDVIAGRATEDIGVGPHEWGAAALARRYRVGPDEIATWRATCGFPNGTLRIVDRAGWAEPKQVRVWTKASVTAWEVAIEAAATKVQGLPD